MDSERVKSIANILKMAGCNVVHIMPENIVQVTIDGEINYVNPLPENIPCDSKLINYKYCKTYKRFTLYFDNEKNYRISLSADTVIINGRDYKKNPLPPTGNIGSLNGVSYLNCKNNVWIDKQYLPFIFKEELFYSLRDDPTSVLNLNFEPVAKYDVDIANSGRKIVKFSLIDHHSNLFTIFIYYDCYIVDDKYTYTNRADLFKYKNEEGELFALTRGTKSILTLTSNRQSIKLHKLDDFILKEDEDGLCGGYIINQANLDLSIYREKYTYDGQFDGYYPLTIYKYKDIIFTINENNNKIVILDARWPNSGSCTKPALRTQHYDDDKVASEAQ